MKYQVILLAVFLLLAIVVDARRGHWRGRGHRGRGHKSRAARHQRQRDFMQHNGRRHRFDWMHRWRDLMHQLNIDFGFDHWGGPRHHNWFGWDEPQKPWWEGPNVCPEENVEETNYTDSSGELTRHYSVRSQICDEGVSSYKCTTTTEVSTGKRVVTNTYQCCHGYTRDEGDLGCPNRLRLRNLLDTARELKLNDLLRAVKSVDMEKQLATGNFTLFAPVDGAFEEGSELISAGPGLFLKDMPNVIMVTEPAVDEAVRGLQNLLLGHVTVGPQIASSFSDEEVLETGSPLGSTIRINFFTRPEKVTTANCVRVVSADNMASNGVIHTVEKILKPVTRSLLDIVRSDPQLSSLKTALAAANYVPVLREDGHYTLLAPTNVAFDKLEPRLRDRLLRGDSRCLEKVLQAHMLPNVICSTVIKGEAKTPNMLHRYLNLTRTEDRKLFVNDAQMIETDVMATNGVLHKIDGVIVPNEALTVLDAIGDWGHVEVLNLIDQAGLRKTLDSAENITVFVPTNDAIKSLPDSVVKDLTSDPAKLRGVLTYHVSDGMHECRHLQHNAFIPSQGGKRNIRINSYSGFPYNNHYVRTAQCVPIKQMNVEACNGQYYVVDGVMLPPEGNVVDVLSMDRRFSTLVSLVKKSGLADILQGDGPFTIFAPTDKAFAALDSETMRDLDSNPEMLREVLENHVFEDTLCCAGIFPGDWMGQPSIRTMGRSRLHLGRDYDGTPKVGRARVTKCDQTATNGNVLEIDNILLPYRGEHRRGYGRRYNPYGFEP